MKVLKSLFMVAFMLLLGVQLNAQDSCQYSIDHWAHNDPAEISFAVYGGIDSSAFVVWNFDDGSGDSSMVGEVVVHTFASAGQYFVTAEITSVSCGTVIDTAFITIDSTGTNPSNCGVMFFYENQGDKYVDFSGLASDDSITSWTWNFGDSTTTQNGQDVSHQFADYGSYFVTLTAESSVCGTMSFSDEIYVYEDSMPDCSAYFFYDMDSSDAFTFDFYNYSDVQDSSVIYAWNFGDGTISSDENPVHTYADSGQFVVTLTITTASCTSTYDEYIWVGDDWNWYPEDCAALFFADYAVAGYEVNFTDLSWEGQSPIINWTWDFGDGTGSNVQNPSHIYSQSGEYDVKLTIFTQTCSSTFEEIVYVEDSSFNGSCQAFFYPEFDSSSLTVTFYDLSMPTPTTWDWNFGDGTTSNLQNPTYTFSDTGVYTVTLMIGDSCQSAFSMDIWLYEQTAKSTVYGGKIMKAHALQVENATKISKISNNNLMIYPNPVNDILNVNFGQTTENATIMIYNVNGQMIFSQNVNNATKTQVNTSDLQSGMYILQATENGKVSTTKFIKK